jgi:hypothetical protein
LPDKLLQKTAKNSKAADSSIDLQAAADADTGSVAQSACVARGVRIPSAPWVKPETFMARCSARDFGTAGI